MKKKGLITEVASETNPSRQDVTEIFERALQKIGDKLAAGEDVSIRGFVNLKVIKRASRSGKNLQIGEAMQIPEKNVVKLGLGFISVMPTHRNKSSLASTDK